MFAYVVGASIYFCIKPFRNNIIQIWRLGLYTGILLHGARDHHAGRPCVLGASACTVLGCSGVGFCGSDGFSGLSSHDLANFRPI